MFKIIHLSLAATLFFSCLIPASQAYCNQKDQDSLLSISMSFSPHTAFPLNWSSLSDCCFWEGIVCDRGGQVTRLWLPHRGLTGSLSASLTNLAQLSHLNLSGNSIVGPLPRAFFESLAALEVLDLSFNRLGGDLISPLNRSLLLPPSIRLVDVSSNEFEGRIPSSIFESAISLLSFNVSNNSLSDTLPSSICRSSSLVKLLDFSVNNFRGQIPTGLIGECSELQVFNAGSNSLSGVLPDDLSDAHALQQLALPGNRLAGTISDRIIRLKNLTVLELQYNEFGGGIPREIGALFNLEKVLLNANNLTGTLPQSLMNCTNLRELILRSNYLEGDISTLNFSKLLQLRILDLGLNSFNGHLPTSLYSCKSLTAIRLSYNQLRGQILPDILALKSLSFLAISHSMLTNISGAMKILKGCENLSILILAKNIVPDEVFPDDNSIAEYPNGYFKKLQLLVVSGCLLTGKIPSWVADIRSLELLDLSSNQLQGSIPPRLGTLPSLFYIDLSDNLISGEFPEELCELSALTTEEAASKENDTCLELPLFFSRNITPVDIARDLQYRRISSLPPAIYLGNNSFGGSIPQRIGKLKFLHMLDLSHNHFNSTIPYQLSNLLNLEKLDLSGNYLSGQIPSSLGTLNFLSLFNVSYNNLEGKIPLGPQLQSFSASVYEGNPKLCGQPLHNHCPRKANEDTEIEEDDTSVSDIGVYVSTGIGFLTGFWSVCAILCFRQSWRDS